MQQQTHLFATKVQRLIQSQIRPILNEPTGNQQALFESIYLTKNTLAPAVIAFSNFISQRPQYKLYQAQTKKSLNKSNTPLGQLLQNFNWATNSLFCYNWVPKQKCTLMDLMRSYIKNIVANNEEVNFKNALDMIYIHYINLAAEKYPELLRVDDSCPELANEPIIRVPNWDQYRQERLLRRA